MCPLQREFISKSNMAAPSGNGAKRTHQSALSIIRKKSLHISSSGLLQVSLLRSYTVSIQLFLFQNPTFLLKTATMQKNNRPQCQITSLKKKKLSTEALVENGSVKEDFKIYTVYYNQNICKALIGYLQEPK